MVQSCGEEAIAAETSTSQPVAEVGVNEFFRLEMADFSGGGITNDYYSAHDIKHVDLSIVSLSLSLSSLTLLANKKNNHALDIFNSILGLEIERCHYLAVNILKKDKFSFLSLTKFLNHVRPLISVSPQIHGSFYSETCCSNRLEKRRHGIKTCLFTTGGTHLYPPVAEVRTHEFFRVEMVDWTGGVIGDNDSASDVQFIDLSITHYLSGPIRVVDEDGVPAKPGDLLVVEICNLGPLPGDEWGYTATFDRENGGGFLTDHFPCATKAIWYFEGIYAYSPQIPGVRFPGLTHPGVIGTAPSAELLNIWNERERHVQENGLQTLKLCEVLHSRPLANLPSPKGCALGKIKEGTEEWERIANEAARTIPGRENGGNCDIKNLSRGSKIYLPVFVEGANFSTGDMHFSQGDGEVSFCGAIEMSGFLELKCDIIRGGMKEYLTPMGPTPLHVNPIFEIGPVEPRFSEWLVFEGISVDESGRQHFLDATVAYKRAVLNAIDYLSKFGYSKEQAYLLLSCCPCEGRISGIVDSPNAVATLAIPTAIFDQDIRLKPSKVPVGPRLLRRPDVLKCSYDGNLPITKNPSTTT